MQTNETYEKYLQLRQAPKFEVAQFCFGKQRAFVEDKAPFATACCSRRAGKTLACCADLVATSLGRSRINCLYLTLNRLSAKRIIWPDLLRINREYKLGAKVNESELTLTFPNESVIYVSGAKDSQEVEKFRGISLALCYIDECQSFRPYIQQLVDEVIAKSLFDYAGRLRLIGTPAPVATGFYYDMCNNEQYSHHKWTMFDNPWLPRKSGLTHEEILQRELDRKGVTREEPSIQRECFGVWAFDPDALVFKYTEERNDYAAVPNLGTGWNYVFGVDLGFDDSDAIAVLGWHEKAEGLYLVEEHVQAKQGITELAAQLESLVKKYAPQKIVMDTGGLGKKIAEEITKRHQIPIAAAEKARKFEYIELLNDALRTRKFFAKKNSMFAHDTKLVEWDKDVPTPEKLKLKDNYHSDICDAVLYAFREAYHWVFEPEIPVAKPYTARWFKEEEERMYQETYERLREVEDNEEFFSEFA